MDAIALLKEDHDKVKGLFENTIDLDEPVAFAHLDGDWYDSTMICLERIGPRHRLIAQRCEGDAFGRPAAAAEHRHLHRLGPEQALNPHQRAAGAQPILLTDATPQRQLQRLGRNHLHRP